MINYDPPPRELNRGQLSKTYCYTGGIGVAYVRKPLTAGSFYTDDSLQSTVKRCPDPYDIPADSAAPTSAGEALDHFGAAYQASKTTSAAEQTMLGVTASEWEVDGDRFGITADLSDVLDEHGPGVYTVVLWGELGGEPEVISEYSIFLEVSIE